MSQARQSLGKTGEDLACRELERRGYAIVARRYRRRGGELDIIARDGQTIVFVEVKTRTGDLVKVTLADKPLFVDHSHATGKVRGLLCRPCNFSRGFMRDDPRLTAAATEYLLKASARDDKPT